MNIPTSVAATTGSGAIYTTGLQGPTSSQLGAQAGAQAAGIASGVYDLVNAKRAIDYVTGAYGLLGGVFAGTALGPYIQGAGVALSATVAIRDYFAGQAIKDEAKRDVRELQAKVDNALAMGNDPGASAAIALLHSNYRTPAISQALAPIVVSSPFVGCPPGGRCGIGRSGPVGFTLIDPETGRPTDEPSLRMKYGSFASERAKELASRVAPGAGMVPAVLARRRAAL